MPLSLLTWLKKNSLSTCFFVMVLLVALLHFWALPVLTPQSIESAERGYIKGFYLPDLGKEIPSNHSYRFTIDYDQGQQTLYHMATEGCIKDILLNNRKIGYQFNQVCSISGGATIDLQNALENGKNLLEIKTTASRLHIANSIWGAKSINRTNVLASLLLGTSLIALFIFSYRRTQDRKTSLILCTAALMFLLRLIRTNFMAYTSDMPGHLEYSLYILKYWALPNPFTGWVSFHPPLYYTIQAIFLWIANQLGTFDGVSMARLFSVFCMIVHVHYSMLSLRRILAHNRIYYCACLLTAFFPTALLIAPRFSNELLLYACYSACLYHLLLWWEKPTPRQFSYVLICLGLAFATRSSALILLPIIGMAVLGHWHKHTTFIRTHLRSGMVWCALLTVLIGLSLGIGRTYYHKYTEHRSNPVLVSNVWAFGKNFQVQNTFKNLVVPDIINFAETPYFNPWYEYTVRRYFINSVVKSALFGEFNIGSPTEARVLCVVFITMLILLVTFSIKNAHQLRRSPYFTPVLVASVVPLICLILMRFSYPFASSQDFRYIFPVTAAWASLAGLNMNALVQIGQTARAHSALKLCLLFILLSIHLYW